jgi:hypothetical protein
MEQNRVEGGEKLQIIFPPEVGMKWGGGEYFRIFVQGALQIITVRLT